MLETIKSTLIICAIVAAMGASFLVFNVAPIVLSIWVFRALFG